VLTVSWLYLVSSILYQYTTQKRNETHNMSGREYDPTASKSIRLSINSALFNSAYTMPSLSHTGSAIIVPSGPTTQDPPWFKIASGVHLLPSAWRSWDSGVKGGKSAGKSLTLVNWLHEMTKQRPSLAMCCMDAIHAGRSSALGAM
jgi:hypothetical protein